MFIPYIYLLFAAEFLFVLIGLTLALAYYVIKLRGRPEPEAEDAADTGPSYAQFLDQELVRNEQRSTGATPDAKPETQTNEADRTTQPGKALQVRQRFLQLERDASEHQDNEQQFWQHIESGVQQLLEDFTETRVEIQSAEPVAKKNKNPSEKAVYIETQGEKIDGEVNKLKDIIYEQENILSSLRKSIKDAEGNWPEDYSDELQTLHAEMDKLERQLNDSRMCMDVLEMENERLQKEVHELESQGAEGGEDSPDLGQMKEVMDKQAEQIEELQTTIDSLQLEAEQADKLRQTLSSFTRTSEEMMGCITILEEENEHLKEMLGHSGEHGESGGKDADKLKSSIKQLEEEIIKKDVEYAKLQDEFTSMEKEYLAVYEALHGDKQ